MAEIIRIKKGLNIPMYGNLTDKVIIDDKSTLFAIVPDDYPGVVWKLQISIGDKIEIGQAIFKDKETGLIALTSPVTGIIREVRRGERRKILAVVIERIDTTPIRVDVDFSSAQSILETLCKYGLWAMIRQRPYDIVARPALDFRDVFVTAFDTAPLAPEIIEPTDREDLELGLEVLSKLTTGKVYLNTRFGAGITSKIAEVTEFYGPHPAGNVGVQIAQINPINKGERILTLDARTAVRIGYLKRTGFIDNRTRVAVTGAEVEEPYTIETTIGASIKTVIDGNLKSSPYKQRVISGNVLTGVQVDRENDFLRYPYRQITVIEEGDAADEFMGWASMSASKYSVKHSFPAFLRGLTKPFKFDARIKGGHRAMILSGEYDKVFPFDIYPEFLIKAIEAHDIDKMEQLGVYEIAPEDFALPEFVDTSKIPLQKIVRDGLDFLRKETE